MTGKDKMKGNISAIITRADGSIENLGMICSTSKFKTFLIKLKTLWRQLLQR
jgi:hypothetical protein